MRVFVGFGRKIHIKEEICNYLKENGYELVVLEDCLNGGKTIIEKLECNSEVSKALFICTGDDLIKPFGCSTSKKCMRQNVAFEIGYFAAKIGRENIIQIVDDMESASLLSDFNIGKIKFKKGSQTWKRQLYKELNGI